MIVLRCGLLGLLAIPVLSQEETPWGHPGDIWGASHSQPAKSHQRIHDTGLYKELAVVARANSDKRFLSSDLEKDGKDIEELSMQAQKSMAQQQRKQERYAEEERARKPLEQIRKSVELGSQDMTIRFLDSAAEPPQHVSDVPGVSWRSKDDAGHKAAEDTRSISWGSLNKDISERTRLSPLQDAAQAMQDAQAALAESHSEKSERSEPLPELPPVSQSGYTSNVDPRRVQRLLRSVQ